MDEEKRKQSNEELEKELNKMLSNTGRTVKVATHIRGPIVIHGGNSSGPTGVSGKPGVTGVTLPGVKWTHAPQYPYKWAQSYNGPTVSNPNSNPAPKKSKRNCKMKQQSSNPGHKPRVKMVSKTKHYKRKCIWFNPCYGPELSQHETLLEATFNYRDKIIFSYISKRDILVLGLRPAMKKRALELGITKKYWCRVVNFHQINTRKLKAERKLLRQIAKLPKGYRDQWKYADCDAGFVLYKDENNKLKSLVDPYAAQMTGDLTQSDLDKMFDDGLPF